MGQASMYQADGQINKGHHLFSAGVYSLWERETIANK